MTKSYVWVLNGSKIKEGKERSCIKAPILCSVLVNTETGYALTGLSSASNTHCLLLLLLDTPIRIPHCRSSIFNLLLKITIISPSSPFCPWAFPLICSFLILSIIFIPSVNLLRMRNYLQFCFLTFYLEPAIESISFCDISCHFASVHQHSGFYILKIEVIEVQRFSFHSKVFYRKLCITCLGILAIYVHSPSFSEVQNELDDWLTRLVEAFSPLFNEK